MPNMFPECWQNLKNVANHGVVKKDTRANFFHVNFLRFLYNPTLNNRSCFETSEECKERPKLQSNYGSSRAIYIQVKSCSLPWKPKLMESHWVPIDLLILFALWRQPFRTEISFTERCSRSNAFLPTKGKVTVGGMFCCNVTIYLLPNMFHSFNNMINYVTGYNSTTDLEWTSTRANSVQWILISCECCPNSLQTD